MIKSMRRTCSVLLCLTLFVPSLVTAQKGHDDTVPSITDPPVATDITEKKTNGKAKNLNLDSKMLYGQYNNIITLFSITQNFSNFTYQLNSDLKRSNDYGYQNTSFYESAIGFTGKADFSESWKFIPELEVNNESHGMYKNSYFSREEKDKVILSFKNDYKVLPSRWDFNLGGAYYVHRLVSAQSADVLKSDFFKDNGEVGWEKIWSASNKLSFGSKCSTYNYATSNDDLTSDRVGDFSNDIFCYNELLWSFKLIEFIKLDLGGIVNWNSDYDKREGFFPSWKAEVSTPGLKYTSFELSYIWDLRPFEPENFYFDRKYIKPTYDLPPGEVHYFDAKTGVEFRNTSSSRVYLERLKVKGSGSYRIEKNFYNFYPLEENVLSAVPTEAEFITIRGDTIFDVRIFQNQLRIGFNYEYYHFWADVNITYYPAHSLGNQIKFKEKRWELEWSNSYLGERYIDISDERRLPSTIIGNLSFQFRMLETFYFYATVENLYDRKFSYRNGYPEPGRILLSGLRIII